jgi:transcriptional regulator with XRE-family HTH domain
MRDTPFAQEVSMPKLRWFEDPEVLRKKRKELGITQHDLAKLAKVKRSLISDIEAERRLLTKDVGGPLWDALANVHIERLKVTPEWEKIVEEERQKLEEERKDSKKIGLKNLMAPAEATQDRVKDKLIEAQQEVIRIQNELISAHKDWGIEKDAKITELETRIAELRDLLGLETDAA